MHSKSRVHCVCVYIILYNIKYLHRMIFSRWYLRKYKEFLNKNQNILNIIEKFIPILYVLQFKNVSYFLRMYHQFHDKFCLYIGTRNCIGAPISHRNVYYIRQAMSPIPTHFSATYTRCTYNIIISNINR